MKIIFFQVDKKLASWAALTWMKNTLRYSGLGLFMAGLTCMPFPVTNPKALTSIFPWFAMSGELVRYGGGAMAVGIVLFVVSFAFRSPEY
jgi:uncharacterized protein YjeT (DUF2065 family)